MILFKSISCLINIKKFNNHTTHILIIFFDVHIFTNLEIIKLT